MKCLLAAVMLFAPLAHAQCNPATLSCAPPKDVRKHRVFDKKFLFATAVNVGVSIAATKKLVDCRRDHGIGPCVDGGYGEFRTRETLRQVLTGTLVLCSYELKKVEDREDSKFKFWWTLQTFNTAWNAGGMIRNAVHSFPPKEKE